MALPSTIRRFEIDLSDIDAHVYEQISLRIAQHPSETDAYLITRLIAYCLQFSEGVEMSKSGLSNADDPPVSAMDLTGQMKVWIDIGLPSTERIHKASKRAEKVVIYSHKGIERVREKLNRKHIHKAEHLLIYPLDADALNVLAHSMGRVNHWSFVHSDGMLFVTHGDESTSLPIEAHRLD